MSRKNKSLSQKILEKQGEIDTTKSRLEVLQQELHKLAQEKDQEDMHKAWEIIKQKGITLQDIESISKK